jgi:predicted patatin/cPLA2 family phospholipase
MDGGIANPLPLLPLNRRLRKNGIRVLAILSKPPRQGEYEPTLLERLIFRRYFQKHPWVIRCLQKTLPLYTQQVRHLKKRMRSQPPKAMVIHPRQMPPAEFITRNRRKINQTIDSGYRAVKQAQDRISNFLQR